ncbi:MAG: hypothetical protein AB7F31_07380 [Parachlamydiales bacterium]
MPNDPTEFLAALDPAVKKELVTHLAAHGLNDEQQMEPALFVGSAPYAWVSNNREAAAKLSAPFPIQVDGPGKTQAFHVKLPYSASLLYKLAPLFWDKRPDVERVLLFSLSPSQQEEYYLALWDAEGVHGLDRLSATKKPSGGFLDQIFQPADPPPYDHHWVWKTLFTHRWDSTKLLTAMLKILQLDNDKSAKVVPSSWTKAQASLLTKESFMPKTLRLVGSIGCFRSPFVHPLPKETFPCYDEKPFPEPQGLLENLPDLPFAKVLAELSLSDLRSLSKTTHWMNATFGGAKHAGWTFWAPLVKGRFPQLWQMELPDVEWRKVFQDEITLQWCTSLFNHCGDETVLGGTFCDLKTPREELRSPYSLSRFLDRVETWLLRLGKATIGSVTLLEGRVKRYLFHKKWVSLAVEGAQLDPTLAQQWWSAVANQLSPKDYDELFPRLDRHSLILLIGSLSDDQILFHLEGLRSMPNRPFEREEEAGLLLIYTALFYSADSQRETQLWEWFFNQSKVKEVTPAFRSIVDTLFLLLNVPPFKHHYEPQVLLTLLNNKPSRLNGFLRITLAQAARPLISIPVVFPEEIRQTLSLHNFKVD